MNDHSNSCLLIFLRDRLQNESLQELRNKDSKGAFQVPGTQYNASSKEFAGNQGNHQKFRPILAAQETLTDFFASSPWKSVQIYRVETLMFSLVFSKFLAMHIIRACLVLILDLVPLSLSQSCDNQGDKKYPCHWGIGLRFWSTVLRKKLMVMSDL